MVARIRVIAVLNTLHVLKGGSNKGSKNFEFGKRLACHLLQSELLEPCAVN
jgi:hypothetical protein